MGKITTAGVKFTVTQAAETPAVITAPTPNTTLSGSMVTFNQDSTGAHLRNCRNIFAGSTSAAPAKQVTGVSTRQTRAAADP